MFRKSRFVFDKIDTSSCKGVLLALQAYLDGELDEAIARQVAVHLDVCEMCGEEADVYVELKRSMMRYTPSVDRTVVERLESFAERVVVTEGTTEEDIAT